MIYEMKQKKLSPLTLGAREKEKKKVSKGLNTGAVRGKSCLLMQSMQEDIWIKKNPSSPSFWHFNHR